MFYRPTALCSVLLAASLAVIAGCGGSKSTPPQLYVTQSSLPTGVAGNVYSETLTATNGVAPYTFSVVSGTLPAGVTLTGGVLSGTPTTVGSYTFTIGVKDSSGQTNTAIYTIGVTGLSGQYFFYEQYFYDSYSNQAVHAASSKGRRGWPSTAMMQQALAHPLHHSAPGQAAHLNQIKGLHPTPAQGSYNSTIQWGSVAGSITLDGSGNITGGEYDTNGSYGAQSGVITGGSYSLGGSSAGTLSLELDGNAGPSYFVGAHNLNSTSFADQTASLAEASTDGATYIEYGDGQLMLQATSLTALQAPLTNNWVFGMRGETCYQCDQQAQGDLLTAGLLNFDGYGNITNTSQADVTTGFDTDTGVALGGTIASTPDKYGRTTAALSSNTYDNGSLPTNYVIYTIDATHAYVISDDQIGEALPAYLYGALDQQSDITFDAGAVSGNYVVWGTGEDLVNEVTPDYASDTQISLLTTDGNGNLTGTADFNLAGSVESDVTLGGTYSVSGAGRVEVTYNSESGVKHARSYVGHAPKSHKKVMGYSSPQVLWLADATHGFGLQETYGDSAPAQLFVGQQTNATYSTASFSGSFGIGSEPTATSNSVLLAGTGTADGVGKLTGTLGAASNTDYGIAPINATYSVAANGRGTATGAVNSVFGSTTFYIVNANQAVAMDTNSADPAPGIIDIQR